MRPLLVAAAVLLAACSSDPVPTDSSLDVGSVADATTDRPDTSAPMDVQVDAGFDVVDVFVATDPAPIVDTGFDAGPVRVDGCGLDPDGACVAPGDVPPDQGAPDVGTADSGTDAGAFDAVSTDASDGAVPADQPDAPDAGPPSCTREGGESCFALPTAAVMASGGPTMPMVAPDFDCALAAATTTAAALSISGQVRDFVTGDAVANATVDVFAGLDYLGASLATATSSASGQYTVTVPSGTRGPLSWRVRASETLDTYLVNDTVNLGGAAVTGSNRSSVDNTTASLLATLLGQSRRAGTGIVVGTARDCQRRGLLNVIATLSLTSSRGTNNRPTFVPDAQVYYYSATPELPARRTAFSSTSSNGLYMALQVPAVAAATCYAQLWGFRTAADVARGAAGLSLLSETGLRVPPDAFISVNHEPLRTP